MQLVPVGEVVSASVPLVIVMGVGGGTLIPWAVIPVAAICDVNPFDLVKKNIKPVVIGLIITTIFATFLI